MAQGSTAKRPKGSAERDAGTKLARQRLSVLQLAEELGNAAEACRRRGMDRTSFYEWKRRFQTQGFAGLKDLPPVHRSHPHTTPPETVERIGALALERRNAEQAIELTAEQVAFIEKLNPCFRERHVESGAPGELLCADTFFVGNLKGIGKVYLHAVVDSYSSYGFGFLHISKQPEAAVAVLHNDVLPFYERLEMPVKAVLTDNGREFCGTDTHPYELYLELNGIEHRKTRVKSPKTNGFVERFNGTVLDEFFRMRMRETFYETVEALQADLDAWLVHYNTERRHHKSYNSAIISIKAKNTFWNQHRDKL